MVNSDAEALDSRAVDVHNAGVVDPSAVEVVESDVTDDFEARDGPNIDRG